MAVKGGLKGIETVTAGLNKELGQLTIRGVNGMRRAVILIRGSMETTPPLVPIGKSRKNYVGGNLRASWFQEFINNAATGQVGVVFGFNANYAVYVHEMMDDTYVASGEEINWSRPGSGPKFLEASVKRNSKEIVRLIALSMKTGK